MTNPIKYFALISLVFALLALPTMGQKLPLGEWHLVSYNFKQKIAYPIDKDQIKLNIHADGKLGGYTGCNVYGGNYEFADGKLRIFDVISTMRACDEPSTQFESSFFSTLGGASMFSIEKGELTITDQKTGNFLRFVKANTKKPRPNN